MTPKRGHEGRAGSPRRPRPMLIGAASVVLIAGLLAWMRYDPLVGGDVTWCPDPSTLVATGVEDPETGETAMACTTVNTETLEVGFAATVRNSGLLPVSVREVRMHGEIEGVLRVDDIRMALRNDVLDVTSRELVAFSPFRLGPGQQRLVQVRGSLTPCEEVTSARVATFRSLPLRTTVFGLPHDSEATLSPPVQLIAERC